MSLRRGFHNRFHPHRCCCVLRLRCLENKMLAHVLSFLGKTPSSYMVCKYWKVCVDELLLPAGAAKDKDGNRAIANA